MTFMLAKFSLTIAVVLQFFFMAYDVCDGLCDVQDEGCLGFRTFTIWDIWDMGYSGYGMLGMWNVRDMGCSGCGMFEM